MTGYTSIKIGGVGTFWKCAGFTVLKDLRLNLEARGWEEVCPEPRAPNAALRSALDELYSGKAWRIEPLANKNSLEVVQIERGEERNEYRHNFRVTIDSSRQVEVRPYCFQTAERIVEAFNKHLGLVTAPQVTKVLMAGIARLHGTHLPGLGNLYWLPESMEERWRELASCVENTRTNGGQTGVYYLRHELDADAVRAVRDGIVGEIEAASEKMHADVLSGELGDRALATRKKEAGELREKIALYEQLLGTGLEHLHAGLEKVEQAMMAATLLEGREAAQGVPA